MNFNGPGILRLHNSYYNTVFEIHMNISYLVLRSISNQKQISFV